MSTSGFFPPEEAVSWILTPEDRIKKIESLAKRRAETIAEFSKMPAKYNHIHGLITIFEQVEEPFNGEISFDLSYEDVQIIIDALACYQKTFKKL